MYLTSRFLVECSLSVQQGEEFPPLSAQNAPVGAARRKEQGSGVTFEHQLSYLRAFRLPYPSCCFDCKRKNSVEFILCELQPAADLFLRVKQESLKNKNCCQCESLTNIFASRTG